VSESTTPSPLDTNQQILERKTKLKTWRETATAFPNTFKREHVAHELHQHFDAIESEPLAEQKVAVAVAGRIMTCRVMGKASFATIQDGTGRIQLYVARDRVDEEVYEQFKAWDLGDIVGAKGVLFKTKTGELSVKVTSIELLVKSLHPLPDKFHGLTDQEHRFRQRYLDLLTNDSSRRVFEVRSQVVTFTREFLVKKGFMEVETPMMQLQPGGAIARPFMTHHNAMDMELYLRVAPELYLKRLVIGGFEKVFELNRNFRNEGISTRHNPEFTMLEFYWAYADYHDLMDFSELLLRELAQKILKQDQIEYQGYTLDLAKPFERLTMKEAILRYGDSIHANDIENESNAHAWLKKLGVKTHPSWGLGKLQMELFEAVAEDKLIQPTFITEYPVEVSPLARPNDQNPLVTDRFELYMAGRELANGFSELNDPELQAERFHDQLKAKEAGDVEAMSFDEDYITALEYGLPPTAGEGIGIDRLVMLFTNSSSIRDVILFPLLRPHK